MIKWLKNFIFSFFQAIDTEEEFLALANNDISQLCGELVLMWNSFLSVCIRKKSIKNHLSRVHHLNRVNNKKNTVELFKQDF